MSDYILEMKNIRKEFFGGKIVANDDINLKIRKGEIHAIVGENGAGKSTLMKMIAGQVIPDSGNIEIGETIKIGYFAQEDTVFFSLLPTISRSAHIAYPE